MFTALTQANYFKKWSPYLLLLPHPRIFTILLYALPFLGLIILSCLVLLLSLIAPPNALTVFCYFILLCGGIVGYQSIIMTNSKQLYFLLLRKSGNADTKTLTIIRFESFTTDIAIEFHSPESDALLACSFETLRHGHDQAYLVYDHKHRLVFDSTTFQ